MIEHVITEDGSSSLFIPELNEHYHSSHGAIREAVHVFIENGLKAIRKPEINIFEVGFGTGLNALLTLNFARENHVKIIYHGIEAFPVSEDLVEKLNYADLISKELTEEFKHMHLSEWNKSIGVSDYFELQKIHQKIQDFTPEINSYDLVYFDAFGYRAQSEMWDITVLQKMYDMLAPNGILVTYAARGQFKRDLKSLGFLVESLPGPPGKREMTRAIKV